MNRKDTIVLYHWDGGYYSQKTHTDPPHVNHHQRLTWKIEQRVQNVYPLLVILNELVRVQHTYLRPSHMTSSSSSSSGLFHTGVSTRGAASTRPQVAASARLRALAVSILFTLTWVNSNGGKLFTCLSKHLRKLRFSGLFNLPCTSCT